MVCVHCHGTGRQPAAQVPCEECGGSGIVHCCEGLCEQPTRAEPAEAGDLERRDPRGPPPDHP